MDMHILKIGTKEVNLTKQPDGSWMATCACRALNGCVHVRLTGEEVRLLLLPRFLRPAIQDALPDTAPQIREIFVSGTTPAEFDLCFRGKLQSHEVYVKLGYVF